jgi:hypothetical protein
MKRSRFTGEQIISVLIATKELETSINRDSGSRGSSCHGGQFAGAGDVAGVRQLRRAPFGLWCQVAAHFPVRNTKRRML